MTILLNDTEVTLPSSLSEYTLGQRIDFHKQHGELLDQMLESIIAMEDGLEKELEITGFMFEKMFRTFAFFTKCTVEAVKESKFIDDVANIYYSSLAVLVEDEAEVKFERSFFWRDEEWFIDAPELQQGSKITFGEFVDAKQLVKDFVEMGRGKWEYMLPLCTIFLRRKDEAYQKEWLYEGSERMAMMRDLPMDKAMMVGFFLSSSVNFAANILMSSKKAEQNPAAST